MKIQYMREYVSVVENHNFTRAAEQCYIAQPSLSKHMMDIEKELGGQLLVRTKHKVEATELGMEVYEGFRNILNRYDSLLETVERVKSGLHGVLRMGVLYYSFESYINDIEHTFNEQYPDIELSILSYQPPQLQKALERDEIDLAITLVYDDDPMPGYEKRVFQWEGLTAAMDVTHPLAQRDCVTLADLSGETIILMKDEPDYNVYIQKLLSSNGIVPGQYCFASQVDTTFQEIRRKNGITLFPRQMDYLQKRGIAFVTVADEAARMGMAVVYKSGIKNPLTDFAGRIIWQMY